MSHHNDAQAMHLGLVTSKVPPAYNGITSWFEYEDKLLDWDLYSELEPQKRAMACKGRLTHRAADLAIVFAEPDMRAQLGTDDGMQFYISTMRSLFIVLTTGLP